MSGGFTPPGQAGASHPGQAEPPHHSAPHGPGTGPTGRPAPGQPGTTTVRKAGRGMAIAAWVAIAAGVALLIGISWSVALDAQSRGLEPAEADATGDLHTMQVVPGMCLESIGDDGAVGQTSVVDCSQPHRAEVITALGFDELRFPGDQDVAQRTLDHCSTRMTDLGPGSAWVAWVPSEDSWHRGDRTALCIATWDQPQEGRVGPDRSSTQESAPPRDDADDQAA